DVAPGPSSAPGRVARSVPSALRCTGAPPQYTCRTPNRLSRRGTAGSPVTRRESARRYRPAARFVSRCFRAPRPRGDVDKRGRGGARDRSSRGAATGPSSATHAARLFERSRQGEALNVVTCSSGVELLMDYVDGVLPAEVRATIDAHVSQCPRCVAFVAAYL